MKLLRPVSQTVSDTADRATDTDKITKDVHTTISDTELGILAASTVDVSVGVSEQCLVRKNDVATNTVLTETDDRSMETEVSVFNVATKSYYMNKDVETNSVVIVTRDSYTCMADRKNEMKEDNVGDKLVKIDHKAQ